MNYKEIPLEEYEELWEQCKKKTRFTNPNIDPIMKQITVQGLSGPGLKFANEYDRILYEHFNPPLPKSIRWYGADGEELIIPKHPLTSL